MTRTDEIELDKVTLRLGIEAVERGLPITSVTAAWAVRALLYYAVKRMQSEPISGGEFASEIVSNYERVMKEQEG